MSLESEIKNLCNPGSLAPASKFLVCRSCGGVDEWKPNDQPPAECSKCKGQSRMTCATMELATKSSAQFVGSDGSSAASAGSSIPTGANQKPSPTSSNTEASSSTESGETKPSETARKPRQSRVRSVPPAQATSSASTADSVEPDARARREAAEKSLIHTMKINPVTPIEVGTGTVDAIGFTTWIEKDGARRPVYHFMELTDTPDSFSARVEAARASDGNIMIDAARVIELSDPLHGCVFAGQLIASLRNGRSRVRCLPGTKVVIAARLSANGRLIFNLTGVKQ